MQDINIRQHKAKLVKRICGLMLQLGILNLFATLVVGVFALKTK